MLYLRQEGRSIGLVNKIRAYALQDQGYDTVDANRCLGLPDDGRNYSVARDMLEYLRIRSVRLLTNNPAKVGALRGLGVKVFGSGAGHRPANRVLGFLPGGQTASHGSRSAATSSGRRWRRRVAMRVALTHNLRVTSSEAEAEFDSQDTITAIARAMGRAGYRVEPIDVTGPASLLVSRLEAFAPDIVFNLAEGHHGSHAASLLSRSVRRARHCRPREVTPTLSASHWTKPCRRDISRTSESPPRPGGSSFLRLSVWRPRRTPLPVDRQAELRRFWQRHR